MKRTKLPNAFWFRPGTTPIDNVVGLLTDLTLHATDHAPGRRLNARPNDFHNIAIHGNAMLSCEQRVSASNL